MITDLKSFEKFLKICRKQGVESIVTSDNFTVKFGDLPQTSAASAEDKEEEEDNDLTPEQLTFFHVGG